MAGGTKLGRKAEAAVACLLTEPTVELAAAKAGVPYRTLKFWLGKRPDFVAAYREARRQIVEHAVAQLQQAATQAVATLVRNLDCGKPQAEIGAAREVLKQAIGGIELADLLERVQALEARLQSGQQPGG